MTTEFELFFNPNYRVYGAVIRKEGAQPETIHAPDPNRLRNYLSTLGLFPSFIIPRMILEAGATLIIRMPKAIEAVDIPDFKLRKADLE